VSNTTRSRCLYERSLSMLRTLGRIRQQKCLLPARARPPYGIGVIEVALDKFNMWKLVRLHFGYVARQSTSVYALNRQSFDDFATDSSTCSSDQYHNLMSLKYPGPRFLLPNEGHTDSWSLIPL
jgi:hypothetical protein